MEKPNTFTPTTTDEPNHIFPLEYFRRLQEEASKKADKIVKLSKHFRFS